MNIKDIDVMVAVLLQNLYLWANILMIVHYSMDYHVGFSQCCVCGRFYGSNLLLWDYEHICVTIIIFCYSCEYGRFISVSKWLIKGSKIWNIVKGETDGKGYATRN